MTLLSVFPSIYMEPTGQLQSKQQTNCFTTPRLPLHSKPRMSGQKKMKEKAVQPVWDAREPTERYCYGEVFPYRKDLQELPYPWTLTCPAGRQMPFISLSACTKLSWTYAFFPISLTSTGVSPCCVEKTESEFCECQDSLWGLFWHRLQLFSLGWREQPDPPGQWGKLCSPFESMSLFKEAFLPQAHVPTGSFLQGLSWKTGPWGRHRSTANPPSVPLNGCFNNKVQWQTVLTETSETSQQYPSFLTRSYIFNSKVHIYKQHSNTSPLTAAAQRQCSAEDI